MLVEARLSAAAEDWLLAQYSSTQSGRLLAHARVTKTKTVVMHAVSSSVERLMTMKV